VRTIVFVGVNKSGSSREAVKAAEQLGYHTVVFTDREKQIEQRKAYKEVHQLIFVDLYNIDELSNQIKKLQNRGNAIVAITSFIDQHVYTASVLADKFCSNRLSTEAVFIMENKEQTRNFFSNMAFTPAFFLIKKEMELPINFLPETLRFPLMVKFSKSTGSKDVLFASNRKELQKNLLRLREKNPEETIIIEEYIEGEQYLVEAIVSNGQIMTAAIIKQEITRGNRFIVTGYGVLAEVDSELEESIGELLHDIVSTLKIENGAFHLELRLTEFGWKLIEINPRISGGAMNKMIQTAFGFSLVEETLKLLIGETPSLEKKTNKFVFTQYVIIRNKGVLKMVTGKRKAMRSPGVVEVYIKPKIGTMITSPYSMGHRYAYVIATGDTLDEAKNLAKAAAQEIRFHLKMEE
jgi:biotin carboxylase